MSLPPDCEELCLDFLIGSLTNDARIEFENHLLDCCRCQRNLKEYHFLLQNVVPNLETELSERPSESLPWSLLKGEERLVAAARLRDRSAVNQGPIAIQKAERSQVQPRHKLLTRRAGAIAASVALVSGLTYSAFTVGRKQGLRQIEPGAQFQTKQIAALQAQLVELSRQRDSVSAGVGQRDSLIADLKSQIAKDLKENAELRDSLIETEQRDAAEAAQASVLHDDFARRLADSQAMLDAAREKVASLAQAKSNDALRLASLQTEIDDLSGILRESNNTIEQQKKMLAADRDIRDLMGARHLYMAELYDLGENGKRQKPSGRVFYTKEKSLIFYAYDLDQQSGLKGAKTFQAWGMRGPDRSNAVNLGVMYMDSGANKKWVLRFDDPKALEQVDAVFVTVEPNGGSRVPTGTPLLVAYLKEEPNHP